MANPEVSVVIGFKNWGLKRLGACLESLRSTRYAGAVQIVVSDYGSDDRESVRELAETWAADYVWSEPVDGWSRAGAINAGFARSTGEIVVATDADMLVTPGTVGAVVEAIVRHPQNTVIIQCRDLPRGFSDQEIELSTIDWDTIARVAQLRPRWGMGGFVASARETALRVRGLDERLHTYGGEDIDYATRCRRAGSRIQWLDDERARVYHMWHEPMISPERRTDPGVARAVEANRAIYQNDRTVVRNLAGAEFISDVALPACSVVVCGSEGAGPSAHLLESLLAQTVAPTEVLVPVRSAEGNEDLRRYGDGRVHVIDPPTTRPDWGRDDLKAVVEQSRGAYVLLEDSDAVYGRRRVGELLDAAGEGVSVVLASSVTASGAAEPGRAPRSFGDMLFERRALLAALMTYPQSACSAGDLLEHLTLNGAETRESGSIGRLVVDPADVGPGGAPRWAVMFAPPRPDAPSELDEKESAGARALLDEVRSLYTVILASSDPTRVEEILLDLEVPPDQLLAEVTILEPSSGVEYSMRAMTGLSFAAAHRAARTVGPLPDVHSALVRSTDGTVFEPVPAAALLLTTIYGASVADNAWIVVDGIDEPADPRACTSLGRALGVVNAVSRTLVTGDRHLSLALFGPLPAGREVEGILAAAEHFPSGASVRLLGPLPDAESTGLVT